MNRSTANTFKPIRCSAPIFISYHTPKATTIFLDMRMEIRMVEKKVFCIGVIVFGIGVIKNTSTSSL